MAPGSLRGKRGTLTGQRGRSTAVQAPWREAGTILQVVPHSGEGLCLCLPFSHFCLLLDLGCPRCSEEQPTALHLWPS